MIRINTALALVAFLLAIWWVRSYRREGDAEGATERVAGTLFGIGVGAFAALIAIANEGGAALMAMNDIALAATGDLLGTYAPHIGNLLTIGWGYAALTRVAIPPAWWVGVAVGIMVIMVMFSRGN